MKKYKFIGTVEDLKKLGFEKGFSGYWWRKKYGKEIYISTESKRFYYWYKQWSFGNLREYIKWKIKSEWIKDLIKLNIVVEVNFESNKMGMG